MLRAISAAGLALTVTLAAPVQAGGLANEIVEPVVVAPADADAGAVVAAPVGLFGGLGAAPLAGLAAIAAAGAIALASGDSSNGTNGTNGTD